MGCCHFYCKYFSSGLFHKFIDLNRLCAHQHYTDVYELIYFGVIWTLFLSIYSKDNKLWVQIWNWQYYNINIKMRQLEIFLFGVIISWFCAQYFECILTRIIIILLMFSLMVAAELIFLLRGMEDCKEIKGNLKISPPNSCTFFSQVTESHTIVAPEDYL